MKSLALVFALALAASAQPTAEELTKRLETTWQPWKDCSPGSWIQMRTGSKSAGANAHNSEMEFRQTLLSRDETGCKVETRTVKRIKDEQGAEKIELGEPSVTTMGPGTGTTYKDVKELDKETVEVGERKLDCRVIEATATYSYAQPGGQKIESSWKVKMWVSDDVKEMGGVVKTETDAENQNQMGGMWSSDMKLVETGKELKIGATTVKCAVYRYGSYSGKEENVNSGELWTYPDAPMGYAKVVSHVKMKGNGMDMEMDTEVVITDMAISKPKED